MELHIQSQSSIALNQDTVKIVQQFKSFMEVKCNKLDIIVKLCFLYSKIMCIIELNICIKFQSYVDSIQNYITILTLRINKV